MTQVDPGYAAQLAAEKHLEACWEWVRLLDEDVDPAFDQTPDMAEPFCGCLTCIVREVLHAATPYLTGKVIPTMEAP